MQYGDEARNVPFPTFVCSITTLIIFEDALINRHRWGWCCCGMRARRKVAVRLVERVRLIIVVGSSCFYCVHDCGLWVRSLMR
jgi:hypothetical protein